MKKILVSMGAAAMTFAMAGTAFAATINQTGSDRGGRSTVDLYSSVKTTVSNSNSANVTNVVESNASTGGNVVMSGKGDIKGVTVVSGNATSGSTVSNALNNIDSTVTAPACACGEGSTGTINQGLSDRGGKTKVEVTTKDKAYVTNANAATAANMVGAGSSTGNNMLKSWKGDIMDIGVMAGMAGSQTTVGNTMNFTSSIVTR